LPAEDLPSEHELWVIETQYIAHAVANILYVLSPQRIIIGGSVAKAGQLGSVRFFGMIRRKLETALNNYISSSAVQEAMDSFVVPPLQGDNAGILGGIALAQMCID
jgi:fructokinase